MKWLKRGLIGILFLLVIAVVGLWIAGQRPDKGYFEISVMINRPISEVYSALLDPEMTKKWVSGVVEIKKLTPGKTAVGTKLLLIEDINGQRVSMEEEITQLEPPHLEKYTARGLGDPSQQFTELGEYRLEEKGGATKFTMTSQMEYHGFLNNFLEPLITPFIRNKFAGDQETLKAILESNASR
jgi:uncharacterized protein YndB with AHSA1/START domain